MKIVPAGNNQSILSIGENSKQTLGAADKREAGSVKNGSINAQKLNLGNDPIADKKQKAMRDAMRLVKNQFKADLKVDDSLKLCEEVTQQSEEKIKEAQEGIGIIEAEKAKFEDKESEEYKERLKNWDEQKEMYQKQVRSARDTVKVMTAVIKGTRQEMLKYNGMHEAVDAAEKTLEAASKETLGMMQAEAVDKLDQDLQEKVEQGQQIKEEQEKTEAELKKVQAEQKKKAEEIEARAREAAAAQSASIGMVEMTQNQAEAMAAITKMLDEIQLLPEDLKGAAVNSLL